jgi:uncharacterized membrane protein
MAIQPVKQENTSEIRIAIVIAIIIGICIAIAIFFVEIRTERFSAVYINPDTYSNYPVNGTVSFVYGLRSYELVNTSYTVTIRAGDTVMETKQVELAPGETYEERKVIQLPENVVYPVKISVQYLSPDENNEVFFRVRNTTVKK